MFHKILKYLKLPLITITLIIIIINLVVIIGTYNNIITEKQATDINDVDCILVLGAGIRQENPSPMLEDRLLQGISLYENKVSSKILLSGDHMKKNYDEVNVMKNYLLKKQIPEEDIFMDHAGISTYDSIYRAKYIFNAKRVIIITQKYHLYRALYIAEQLDLEAYGVASNPRGYANQIVRDARELLARVKDFFKVKVRAKSTYLGDAISLEGDGRITNG